ncbi:unnamed protein product [Amoebophrya sp. A120]|nr:unnamed protein product [Amoebophrya sp. A120]|eukprot:GSA120T00002802001.1
MPLRGVFESAGLRPWKNFVRVAVPRHIAERISRSGSAAQRQPNNSDFQQPLRLTQAVDVSAAEIDLGLTTLNTEQVVWKVGAVRNLGRRDLFSRAKVKVEMRLLLRDEQDSYDPEEDEYFFFPEERAADYERKRELFEKIKRPSRQEVRAKKNLEARCGKDLAAMTAASQETDKVSAQPGAVFAFDSELSFDLEALTGKLFRPPENQSDALYESWDLHDVADQLFSMFHVVVWGQEESTSYLFARDWQPLCHFKIPFSNLLQYHGLQPVRLHCARSASVDDASGDTSSSDGNFSDENQNGKVASTLDGTRRPAQRVEESSQEQSEFQRHADSSTVLRLFGSLTSGSILPQAIDVVHARMRRSKAKAGLVVRLAPAGSLEEVGTRNSSYLAGIGTDHETDQLPEPPKKVLLAVNVTHARGLPQTRTKMFGGKGCYPFARVNLTRGNPLKDDEDASAVLEQKTTHTRAGTSVNFKQRLALGPLSSEERNLFVHVEVFDSSMLLAHDLLGRCSIGVHEIFQLRGVRSRKLKLFASGQRQDDESLEGGLLGGGVSRGATSARMEGDHENGDRPATTEGEFFLKFEKVEYEADKELGVQVRLLKAVLPSHFPPFPLENVREPVKLFAEARLCKGGDPRHCLTDAELDDCTLYKTVKPATMLFSAKTRAAKARSSGKANLNSRRPEFNEVLKLVADDVTHSEDVYFYLQLFYEGKPNAVLKAFFGGREKYLIGQLSIPSATLLQHFGHRGLRLHYAPGAESGGGWDLSKARLHVAVECKSQ